MGKVYFLLLFFAVFGIFSGERGVNNRLRVRGADEGDYKDARNPLYRLGYFRKYSWQGSGKTILSGIKGLYFCELMATARLFLLFYADIITGKDTDFGKAGY